MAEDKGPHRAIRAARMAGRRLVLAGPVQPGQEGFFEAEVEPWIDGSKVAYIGEISGLAKANAFADAFGLLMPIRWQEPFGLVMVEALAAGTPVLAFPEGSATEIVIPGQNGFLVDDESEMAAAVELLHTIDPAKCRRSIAKRYTSAGSGRQDSTAAASSAPTTDGVERFSRITNGPAGRRVGLAVRTGGQTMSHAVSTHDAKASLARDLVDCLGGRYSTELGIDLGVAGEVERWALAATLFGARISTDIAGHTFRVLSNAGMGTLGEAGSHDAAELIALLDEGGYARYDFRTADKLHRLAGALEERWDGRISALVEQASGLAELEAELDALPGWGAVTVGLFLRELRGWRSWLEPPLDSRSREAAEHLGLLGEDLSDAEALEAAERLARRARVDVRDLEAALLRASLVHGRHFAACAGGEDCEILRRRGG